MNPGIYVQLAAIEDKYWFHVSRRQLVEDYLTRLNLEKNARGLDIGCGTGGNCKLLEKYCSEVYGLDLSEFALELAKKRGLNNRFIRDDANNLADIFAPESFGLVTIFHVLYHEWISSEQSVLQQVHRILKPGGYVVITEPSFNILKRNHDIQDMGKRRYLLKPFEDMLTNAGFTLISGTYFNSISFLPALATKYLEKISMNKSQITDPDSEVKELQMPNTIINELLIKAIGLERMLIRLFGKAPFGVSLLCIARKPLH